MDKKFGYDRYTETEERMGWLINFHPVSVGLLAVGGLIVKCPKKSSPVFNYNYVIFLILNYLSISWWV